MRPPVLASLEGETAEILRVSGAAIVVPPEDVDVLAAALVRLAAEPALRPQLAARGRHYDVEHIDRRPVAERNLELLAGVVRRAPAL